MPPQVGGGGVSPVALILAGHVVKHLLDKGFHDIRTRDNGVHLPSSLVLVGSLTRIRLNKMSQISFLAAYATSLLSILDPNQASAVPRKNFLCRGMLRHAAACFCLHMWVPTLLWEIELTCKRQHAQHCWAELITFIIRIVCSGFVDIHHSQMAQSAVAI